MDSTRSTCLLSIDLNDPAMVRGAKAFFAALDLPVTIEEASRGIGQLEMPVEAAPVAPVVEDAPKPKKPGRPRRPVPGAVAAPAPVAVEPEPEPEPVPAPKLAPTSGSQWDIAAAPAMPSAKPIAEVSESTVRDAVRAYMAGYPTPAEGHAAIRKVLEGFGATRVGEVQPTDREAFIAALKAS